jgi:hypothetical protein
MRRTQVVALAFAWLFFTLAPAQAEVRFLCEVSYQTLAGWSDGRIVEVTFASGKELNSKTRTLEFDIFANYAMIWFGAGQVAILKHDGFSISPGPAFDVADFKRMFLISQTEQFEQVNSEYERRWRIRAKDLIRFIDPRVRR